MSTAELNFNGIITVIQCNENEKMKEIIKRYCIKAEKNKEEINFLYGGNIIDENKTFNELASSEDKKRKKISILVNDLKSRLNQNNNLKQSKYIFCPKCDEPVRVELKNFKINLFGSKNGYEINNLSFPDLNQSLLINESKITCDICHNTDKSKTYNNSFFRCGTCNKNICPLCSSSHDKKHILIDYDKKYFKCNLYNESYTLYCNNCNKNICVLCEKDHNNHNIISLGKMIPEKNKLEEDKSNLKIVIDKFIKDIKEIIDKLKNVMNNIESYYNIYNELISGFEAKPKLSYITKFKLFS